MGDNSWYHWYVFLYIFGQLARVSQLNNKIEIMGLDIGA